MSDIKRYEINWNDCAFMTVEVDHSKVTEEALHETNNFWSGAEDRIDDEDGSVLNAVLKMLANACFTEAWSGGWGVSRVVDRFDYDCKFGNGGIEGWPKMDGSSGIKLIACDVSLFTPHDTQVKEVTANA